jgi:hypothetical protein
VPHASFPSLHIKQGWLLCSSCAKPCDASWGMDGWIDVRARTHAHTHTQQHDTGNAGARFVAFVEVTRGTDGWCGEEASVRCGDGACLWWWGDESRMPCADEAWGAVAGSCPHCAGTLVVEEEASSALAAQARGDKEREPSEWQQAQEEISLILVASPTSFV